MNTPLESSPEQITTTQRSQRYTSIWKRRAAKPTPTPTGARWTPPRCPHRDCEAHEQPEGTWFRRKGSHWPLCRERPVKRFRCNRCSRWFSCSSFRADRCDNKPWHNTTTVCLLTGGVGLRETARKLKMSRTALQMKARKLSLHCHHLHRNQLQQARLGPVFMMDEAVMFEEDRRLRPLSLATVIDVRTWLMVDSFSATMPPHGSRSAKTKRRIQELEAAEGPRKDRHKTAVAKVLRTVVWQQREKTAGALILISDRKPTYKPVLRRVCRAAPHLALQHVTFKGDAHARGPRCPLFPINHTFALMRDRVGRFRRKSWLHSKRRKWLNRMVSLFLCVRNYVRPWKNDASKTPGELADLPAGRLTRVQMLKWRQDWGLGLSIPPKSQI